MFVTITLNPAVDSTVSVRGVLRSGEVYKIMSETVVPGGKGVNVAKAAATAAAGVVAGGIIGASELGMYSDFLSGFSIKCDFMPVNYETRRNIMVIDESGNEMKLNRPGFPGLTFDWDRLRDYCLGLAGNGDVIIMSGSLPENFPADTYARLIELFKSVGKTTALDASGEALKAGVAALPDVIKPNRKELAELAGTDFKNRSDLACFLKKLSKKHRVVIMSDGAHGAWFASDGKVFLTRAPEVKTVDTTGAGDALLGWFCSGYFLKSGRALTEEVMANAVASGSACVELRGFPTLPVERVGELARRVRVELIA